MPTSRIPPSVLNQGTGQTPGSTSVGATSTQIVASNASRISVFLLNIGKEDVWVACDVTALLNKGMLLGRNGGSMLIDSTSFTNGAVNGICASGKSSTITFQELTK